MATKKTVKKAKLAVGDYVRVNKNTIGVVTGFEENIDYGNYDDDGDNIVLPPDTAFVAMVDQYGENDNNTYLLKTLTKINAPEYVVVWTDKYDDPFTQFATRVEADKFVAKKRKDKDIAEVRIYKLTK